MSYDAIYIFLQLIYARNNMSCHGCIIQYDHFLVAASIYAKTFSTMSRRFEWYILFSIISQRYKNQEGAMTHNMPSICAEWRGSL